MENSNSNNNNSFDNSIKNNENEINDFNEFYNNLNNYFELKYLYEKKLNKKKNTILNDKSLSKKEKTKKYRNISIPCINCKRNVGTIFDIQNNIYVAFCGDREKPCNLDIQLKRPNIGNIYKLSTETKEELNNIQENMFILKLSLLFGFISEEKLVDVFSELKDDYNQTTELLDIIERNIQEIENKKEYEKKMKIFKNEFYESINQLKKNINEYLVTQNIALVKDSIELYIDSIKPTQEELRNLKFDNMYLDIDDKDKMMILKKIERSIKKSEFVLEEPEVISFRYEPVQKKIKGKSNK